MIELPATQSKVFVNIGEIKIIENPDTLMWSILGSCVSVIFFINDNLSLACHAQMPNKNPAVHKCFESCPHPCFNYLPDSSQFKYVSCALENMIKIIKDKKINLHSIHTSLIGGASLMNQDFFSIGAQNINEAKKILEKNHIKINREITGGSDGINFWFYPARNQLLYKRHKTQQLKEF